MAETEKQNARLEQVAKFKCRNYAKRYEAGRWYFKCRLCGRVYHVDAAHVKADAECFLKCQRIMAQHLESHLPDKEEGDRQVQWMEMMQSTNYLKWKAGVTWHLRCNVCRSKVFHVTEGNLRHDPNCVENLKRAMAAHIREHQARGIIV